MPAATYSRITNQAKKDICDEIPSKLCMILILFRGLGSASFSTAEALHQHSTQRSATDQTRCIKILDCKPLTEKRITLDIDWS